MNLHEHCLRNVAGALRDIARTEHPDLTFEVDLTELFEREAKEHAEFEKAWAERKATA